MGSIRYACFPCSTVSRRSTQREAGAAGAVCGLFSDAFTGMTTPFTHKRENVGGAALVSQLRDGSGPDSGLYGAANA